MLSRVARKATVQLCKSCRTVNTTGYGAKPWTDMAFSPVPQPSEYALGRQRSNAEKLIAEVPVIEVKGTMAICDGGSGALGHPVEFIQLFTGTGNPQVCKYCGLRFKMAPGKHHAHH